MDQSLIELCLDNRDASNDAEGPGIESTFLARTVLEQLVWMF
jgi:hypothetical protein